jgi:diadenosine tetraphosphatase ApaH/serine/threonine PP2A family protein phosphatase
MLLGELPLPAAKDETYRIGDARARLSAADRDYVLGWPDHRALDVEGKKLLLAHGSPADRLQGYVYPDSDLTPFDGLEYDAVIMGHTHRPFVARRGDKLVVNVGSCGLPRDQGNLAAFGVFDASTFDCNIYRLPFSAGSVVDYFGAGRVPGAVYECLFREPSGLPFGQHIR